MGRPTGQALALKDLVTLRGVIEAFRRSAERGADLFPPATPEDSGKSQTERTKEILTAEKTGEAKPPPAKGGQLTATRLRDEKVTLKIAAKCVGVITKPAGQFRGEPPPS